MTAPRCPRLVAAYVGPVRGLTAYLSALAATAARTAGGAR